MTLWYLCRPRDIVGFSECVQRLHRAVLSWWKLDRSWLCSYVCISLICFIFKIFKRVYKFGQVWRFVQTNVALVEEGILPYRGVGIVRITELIVKWGLSFFVVLRSYLYSAKSYHPPKLILNTFVVLTWFFPLHVKIWGGKSSYLPDVAIPSTESGTKVNESKIRLCSSHLRSVYWEVQAVRDWKETKVVFLMMSEKID